MSEPAGASRAVEGVRRGSSRAWAGLVLLAALGALLGVLPHLVAWRAEGSPRYIADGDELLYRAWSRGAALRGTWRLEDAIHRESGPMMHPWLTFVPAARLAYALGLDLDGLAILWRAIGGAGIALGLYAAIRPTARHTGLALGVAAFLLCDAGLLHGQLVLREAEIGIALVSGRDAPLFVRTPQLMPHLRVVTPALALPTLLLHYGLAIRARIDGGRARALAAAASFGLLASIYSYFFTAVAAGLALAFAIDPRGRRLHATILLGGLALGAPGLLVDVATKARTPPDWLLRTDKFVPVARFDLDGMLLPRRAIVLWLACGVAVFRPGGRRELAYLWCCTGAALACANQQVVTGLQIENFHWQQAEFVTLSLMSALIVVPWIAGRGGSRGRSALLGLALAAQVVAGLGSRQLEGARTAESLQLMRIDRDSRRDALPIPDGAVVAGDADFQYAAAARGRIYPLTTRLVLYSSKATDVEVDERVLLDLYLLGYSREGARDQLDPPAWAPSPAVRPEQKAREPYHQGAATLSKEAMAARGPAFAAAQAARRADLLATIWDDPRPLLRKYGVTHVVPRVEPGRPGRAHLRGIARLVTAGTTYELWEIRL